MNTHTRARARARTDREREREEKERKKKEEEKKEKKKTRLCLVLNRMIFCFILYTPVSPSEAEAGVYHWKEVKRGEWAGKRRGTLLSWCCCCCCCCCCFVLFCFGDVPLVEFMCLVFTYIMPDESYLRRLEVVLL